MSEPTCVTVAFPPLPRQGEYLVSERAAPLAPGELVVVEGLRGLSLGRVIEGPHPRRGGGQVRKVVRPARESDLRAQQDAEQREPVVLRTMLHEVRQRKLPWKVISVVSDGVAGKFTVCFVAPERADAKELARVVGGRINARIELRQLGARDEARILGGVGRCGRELCCSTFLPDFPRVTVKMAKNQNLALAQDKTGGVCGRTMCCLAYENDFYIERRVYLPRPGKRAVAVDGTEGRVVAIDVHKMTFTVVQSGKRRVFSASEWEGNAGREVPGLPTEAVVALPSRRPRTAGELAAEVVDRPPTGAPSGGPPPGGPGSGGEGRQRAEGPGGKPKRRRRRRGSRDGRPQGRPSGRAGAGGQPPGGAPAGAEPAGAEPAGGKPAGGEPAGGEPAGGEPPGRSDPT